MAQARTETQGDRFRDGYAADLTVESANMQFVRRERRSKKEIEDISYRVAGLSANLLILEWGGQEGISNEKAGRKGDRVDRFARNRVRIFVPDYHLVAYTTVRDVIEVLEARDAKRAGGSEAIDYIQKLHNPDSWAWESDTERGKRLTIECLDNKKGIEEANNKADIEQVEEYQASFKARVEELLRLRAEGGLKNTLFVLPPSQHLVNRGKLKFVSYEVGGIEDVFIRIPDEIIEDPTIQQLIEESGGYDRNPFFSGR